jgi:hypothetical protein
MASQKKRYRHYVAPSAPVVDAIYSFEDGGINPARDRSVGWPAERSSLEQYRASRALRSCYQGFWGCTQKEGR